MDDGQDFDDYVEPSTSADGQTTALQTSRQANLWVVNADGSGNRRLSTLYYRKAQWLPEAMKFIQEHRAELARKRVATFTVCITLAMSSGDQYHQAVAGWIAPVRAQVKSVSEGLFAGRLDFTKLPLSFDTLKFRLVVALGIFPKDDRRDWKAIRAWAENLSPLLLQ